ncbi:MAG TPA: class I SAM-dependent methyltransferase [Patescibacteria group bacterium]|nr:class I SAM-dependent methyltransferase [Patescibacteria group bacterium]
MNERIAPVSIPSNKKLDYYGTMTPLPEVITQRIANPDNGQRWPFPVGDPEFWKHSDKLLVKGGTALDLGMGFGRSSLYFALNGMNVVGYEVAPKAIEAVKALKDTFNLPIEIRQEDFGTVDLGENLYDTAFLAQTLVHSPSEDAAYELIDKAIRTLKPGGRLWLRAAGIYDGAVDELSYYSQFSPEVHYEADNLYFIPCACSGEWKMEPQIFLDPMEVAGHMAANGMKIEHTNVAPDEEKANIMFGEDWKPDNPKSRYNFITLIAQKPSLA